MKFTLIKNIQEDSAMSLILKLFLVFIFIYIIADILVMNSSIGLNIEAVKTTLFGNEQEYIDPINESSFLEFWHTQIFFIMMILLTLNAIFIRVAKRSRIISTNILMISAISSLVSILLAYYVSDIFIYIYILSFFIWHAIAIFMIVYSFWRLNASSI